MMKNKQQGAVLMVSVIVLLVLLLLGVSAMGTTLLEERMAKNYNNVSEAFEEGEAALRDAERWVEELVSEPIAKHNPTTPDRVWLRNDLNSGGAWWKVLSDNGWSNQAVEYNLPLENDFPPLSFIEERGFIVDSLNIGGTGAQPGVNYYQITAKGIGSTVEAQVLLQSVTARRY